mgnify:CR=1 FL=1
MEKLTTKQAETLNNLLKEQTPEQCIITMRTAMNAFLNKACEEITPYAGVQYGRLAQPLAVDMARLEAFHDALKEKSKGAEENAE